MSEAQDGAAAGESNAPIVAAVLAVLLAAMVVWPADDFALDDAWIHLDYAKSLRLGDGWSYNPGDHEAGCSSPLWVLLLAVWPTAGDPVPSVLALGVLLHALTAWTAAALALSITRRRATVSAPLPAFSIGLLAGALVATSPLHLHGVGSGMEVPLASALVLGVGWATSEGRARAAAVLGALAMLSRPELGAWIAVLAGAAWAMRSRVSDDRRRAATLALVGAITAAVAWAVWLLATVGAPVPNAWFIKGRGGAMAGLGYVAEQVAPWQPWLIGLGGIVLAGAALRRHVREKDGMLAILAIASIATVILVASTRPLHDGVQFFESRYFGPLFVALPVVVALGLGALPRLAVVVALVPVAALSGLQAKDTRARVRAGGDDIRVLHRQPALWVASELPRDAIVATEGAGAMRFFAPRTMTIVDLVGLNDHVGARLHYDRDAKICHWIARGPTHAVVPAEWLGILDGIFAIRPLAVFEDAEYTQVEPVRPVTVVAVEIGPVRPGRACP